MKHFLTTTALVAGIAFGGAAFAQAVSPTAAVPVVDNNGNPLYTWTNANGQVQQGTFAQFTAAFPAVTAPVGARPDTAGPAQTTWDTAQAAYLAYQARLDSVVALVDGDAPAPYQSESLLDNILADAAELSTSLSNVSQNLNDINGSIEVNTDRDYAAIADGIEALIGEYDGFGSFSQVNANVFGVDLPASLLAVLNPLTLELGNLSTTAIGTLQSGNMTATFDASGIVNKVTSAAEGSTTSANMLAETYGGIAQTVAMQNVSVNSGDINGSVDLILADVNTKVGTISTTAIGALQSGAMTASVDGAIGSVSHNSSALVNALVGAPSGTP
ncbi:MAG: hypothetical protein KGZ77_02960 [Rhodobacteraceae bacterium]|nr:hypothetical protein [Paracoccaceae bacterium]